MELKPDYAEVHCNLGNALRDQGKSDEGLACYRRALEVKPDYAEVYGNLGNALKEQGKLDEAAACCRRALELKPDYAEGHGNLGGVLEEIGDLQVRKNATARRCSIIPTSPLHIPNWRRSSAENFRSRSWTCSFGCWRPGS